MYNFKNIKTVLGSNELIDVTLSGTQRGTPTVVHPQFKVSRIRSFYMRKVKYCQSLFREKLAQILEDFPRVDDLHPFYSDLFNILYDKDHYKLALGSIKSVLGIVEAVCKDYLKLIKFAESPYKCKSLKRAAMGRMATAIRKLKTPLDYLEEVRQHLARMPQIDPSVNTLILTGYPNVGKSSFMNLLTRANVDVQSYAFTTKSLFVGHLDHSYERWQVLDSPGLLDRPLNQRNSIEMVSITALAHLPAVVLFVLDVSTTCGWGILEQLNLLRDITPLFRDRTLMVLLNKTDLRPLSELTAAELKGLENANVQIIGHPYTQQGTVGDKGRIIAVETSCYLQSGVDIAKNIACSKNSNITTIKENSIGLDRVEGNRCIDMLTVVAPRRRVDERALYIPVTLERVSSLKGDHEGPMSSIIPSRHESSEMYFKNQREEWIIQDRTCAQDILPEVINGRNVTDYIDEDIENKLQFLESEEFSEKLAATKEGTTGKEGIPRDRESLFCIRDKMISKRWTPLERKYSRRVLLKRKSSVVPRPCLRDETEFTVNNGAEEMQVADELKAERQRRLSRRRPNILSKGSESDRHVYSIKPKHLYSGTGGFKRDRR